MTITNEVNLDVSSNTSDGSYKGAEGGADRRGSRRRTPRRCDGGFRQLRFGFTYAYRFSPQSDAAFFTYLGAHGGRAIPPARWDSSGLDFYPGTFYPPMMPPGDTYRAELAQAAGVVRDCFMPKAQIGRSSPDLDH